MRYTIKSEKHDGEKWHYVCDTKTGGFVDMTPDRTEAEEICKALNDGRTVRIHVSSNLAEITAREIGGAL